MICPRCKRKIKIKHGQGRRIHGVWVHKRCPTKAEAKSPPERTSSQVAE